MFVREKSQGRFCRKGFEPNDPTLLLVFGAMERARSVPGRVPSGIGLNPFHSEKVQLECLLGATRPVDLPEEQVSFNRLQDRLGRVAAVPQRVSLMAQNLHERCYL
jgi:hypothetical protein